MVVSFFVQFSHITNLVTSYIFDTVLLQHATVSYYTNPKFQFYNLGSLPSGTALVFPRIIR
jgi:hypothetical protein